MRDAAPALRDRLAERALQGTFLKLPRREVVEILAAAGYDFAICDLEHAQMAETEAREVILAGTACGLPIVVRVASLDPGLVNRLLEAGAAGIQAPRTRGPADVEALRAACLYPPEGGRSVSLQQPAAGYGAVPLRHHVAAANRQVLLVGQLETADLEEPLDGWLGGLDVAFVGSVDLRVALAFDEAAYAARLAAIEEAARRAGVTLGIFAATAEEAAAAAGRGHRYLAVGGDLTMLRQGALAARG